MPSFIPGKDGKFYIDAAVTAAVVAADVTGATLVENIKDVTINVSVEMADITTRESGSWENVAPTIKAGSVKFQQQWKTTDANFETIKTAFIGGTEFFAAALDGLAATTGSQGLAGNFVVSSFEVQQSLKGVQMVDIEIRPSSFTTWFKKTGS